MQTQWNYLMTEVFDNDEYCVAGFMGNLYAESHCLSVCVQPSHFDDAVARQYVADVNSGTKSRYVFANDGKGFGLPQWTYYTRKEDLYDFLQNTQPVFDIGSLDGQLSYIKYEFQNSFASLKTSMQNVQGTDQEKVYKCADLVLENYEKPEVFNYTTRRDYALEIYNHYSGIPISGNAVNVIVVNPDSGYGYAYAMPSWAEESSQVQLYYQQLEGLTFEGFSSTDVAISAGNNFIMPNNPVTVYAHFSGSPLHPPTEDYSITVKVASNLTISYSLSQTSASAGTTIALELYTDDDPNDIPIYTNGFDIYRHDELITFIMPAYNAIIWLGKRKKKKLLVARNPQLMVTKRRNLL